MGSGLSAIEISNRLYEISLLGYSIVPECDDPEWGHSYAVSDGRVVISSGATIEDAIEDYDRIAKAQGKDQ